MKIKLTTMIFSGLFLTGCASNLIAGLAPKQYQTKWQKQCLVSTQDIQLNKGPNVDNSNKNFISSLNSTSMPRFIKPRDILKSGTKFEVTKIYDNYIHGLGGDWHLRVNAEVLNGPYKGLEVEMPGTYMAHPLPFFFTHRTQVISYTARENLQPNSIIFNPEFLTPCTR